MRLSRSHRRVNNLLAIRLGQLLVVVSIGTGLLLITAFDEDFGIVRHSSPHYATLWAFVATCASGLFFALREDLRWQKSVGSDPKAQ